MAMSLILQEKWLEGRGSSELQNTARNLVLLPVSPMFLPILFPYKPPASCYPHVSDCVISHGPIINAGTGYVIFIVNIYPWSSGIGYQVYVLASLDFRACQH